MEPAPRVVAQPENQLNQQAPLILSIIVTPINFIYTLFSRVFNLFGRLFTFLPRMLNSLLSRLGPQRRRRTFSRTNRRPLAPQDTSARFIREFEEEYGATTIPFLETGYARAFDMAKRDFKFLLIVPLAMEHDDTNAYIRNVLLAEQITTFLNNPANNILLWSGTIQDSETYQVASELRISSFPSAILIAPTSATAMSVIARITGMTTSEDFTARLQAAMSQHNTELARLRAARSEQQAARNIREQQDSAYERSLAQDRERARQRREAEAAAARAELEARELREKEEKHARNLDEWKRWRAVRVHAEPDKEDKTAVRIQLRLPDGERVIRRFDKDAELEELYAYVECHDYVHRNEKGEEDTEKAPQHPPEGFTHSYTFQLVSPMPRQVYGLEKGGKISDTVGKSASLIVEKLDE